MFQIFPRTQATLAIALTVLLSGPATAFHRKTPAVTALTISGDSDLPRTPSQGRRTLAIEQPSGIVTILPFISGPSEVQMGSGASPAVAYDGRVVVWETDDDPLDLGLPGWQIVRDQYGIRTVPVPDPSGTSHNPSTDKRGQVLAFESQGDLTNTGIPGVTRVYVQDKTGALATASTGVGESGNVMVAPKRGMVAFESTSDPVSGVDTGVSQLWVGFVTDLPGVRITSGAGDTTHPIVSDDGRLVAFTSTADLAGDGHDTGTSQVFVYDYRTETFAQITAEPSGCGRPGAAKIQGDWRITYVCGGQAYFTMLRANQRYHVQTTGGSVQSIIPEMGVHFLMVSTNADLLAGSGSTSGHQIYMLNVFVRPPEPVAGTVTWFPFQGIPGF